MAKKMLIVYYSLSNGNTRAIARQLQAATGADLAEIETAEPYTGSYDDIVRQGQEEVNSGYLPALRPLAHRVEDYDVIAVGSPTWWYTIAPAVRSFLTEHDWKGKTVIPFQTHAGWPGHFMQDIRACCPGAVVSGALSVRFDSDGGTQMMTRQAELNRWFELVKQIADH